MAKKWQEDPTFCAFLVGSKYATEEGGKIKPFLTLGLVIYMFEAWEASRYGDHIADKESDASRAAILRVLELCEAKAQLDRTTEALAASCLEKQDLTAAIRAIVDSHPDKENSKEAQRAIALLCGVSP